jgi:ubiquinone/menaquinone biosynthesis C-methylase UbiE
MTSIDPYRVTDQLNDAVLDVIATRLEARGRHPVFVRMLDEYLDAMRIDDATAVIDLGCGTGVASRRIVRRSGFSGHITGIDRSPFLIDAATSLAGDDNLPGRIDFRVGDTQNLDFGAGHFDAVVAHTLIATSRVPPPS